MRTSLRISVGGVAAALGLVLMLLTGFVPFGTYAFPALAGILLTVIVIEFGVGHALAVFAVTALLSFFIAADKEAALFYAAFLGYYPVIKSLIERIRIKPVQYAVKLALFNAAAVGEFFIAAAVFSVPAGSYTVFGVYIPWAFLLMGNIVFILYDVCVTRLITLYLLKWHKTFNKNTKL